MDVVVVAHRLENALAAGTRGLHGELAFEGLEDVPGPLLTFSAYLGAASGAAPNGAAGGILAHIAIFLPSFLLVVGGLPVWSVLRQSPVFQSALCGINASVVGLLLAALYDPVGKSAIFDAADALLALACLALLARRVPPWLVVVSAAAGGAGIPAM